MATTSKKRAPKQDRPAPLPEWLTKSDATFEELEALPANWNSYGAVPIRREAIDAAQDLLRRIARYDTPPPSIVPTNHGGIQLEWHTRGLDLEIEIPGSGPIHAWYGDDTEEIDLTEAASATQLPRLIEFIARLSPAP